MVVLLSISKLSRIFPNFKFAGACLSVANSLLKILGAPIVADLDCEIVNEPAAPGSLPSTVNGSPIGILLPI